MTKKSKSKKKTKPAKRQTRPAKEQTKPAKEQTNPAKVQTETFGIASAAHYSSYPHQKYHTIHTGSYSITKEHNIIDIDKVTFPLFIDKLLFPLDLSVGYEEYCKEAKGLDFGGFETTGEFPLWQKFLYWISESEFDVNKADFIGRRGIFRKIGSVLYDNYYSWRFRVCKYRGKVYLHEINLVCPIEPDEHAKRCSYWGRKFEDLVTEKDRSIKSSYHIVKSNIGAFRLLLACEIDCVKVANDPSNSSREYHSIELKTCKRGRQSSKFPSAWLQSSLSGIDTLIFGLRDEHGLVDGISEYSVSELPIDKTWNGGAMYGMISAMLNWVYVRIGEGYQGVLSFKGDEAKVIRLTTEPGIYLPVWYQEYVDKVHDT